MDCQRDRWQYGCGRRVAGTETGDPRCPAALAAGRSRPIGRPVRGGGVDAEPVAPAVFCPAGDRRTAAADGGNAGRNRACAGDAAGAGRAAACAGTDNGVPAKTLVPTDPSGYTVCGRVYISNSTKYTLTGEELLKPFAAELTGDAPQILILHSHGSEGYTPAEDDGIVWSGNCRTTDSRYNVVRMGDAMAEVFGEAGISVLHDRTLYDYPEYAGSYDRSLTAIDSYLKEYPSIRFVLDVHRDAIEAADGSQVKVVSEIEGQGTAAQLSLVVGSDGGGLSHPNWMENLRLAVAIQEQALTDYPTLMRPLLLRNSRYNQHATTGSLLVEVGTAGNAPEEAELAARLFAAEMVTVLEERSK